MLELNTSNNVNTDITDIIIKYYNTTSIAERSSISNKLAIDIKECLFSDIKDNQFSLLNDFLSSINKFLHDKNVKEDINNSVLKLAYEVLSVNTNNLKANIVKNFLNINLIIKENSTNLIKTIINLLHKSTILTVNLTKLYYTLLKSKVFDTVMNLKNVENIILETFEYDKFPTPNYTFETRMYVYYILIELIEEYIINQYVKYESIINNSSNTFYCFVLSTIENEKDPRNIIVIFNLLSILLKILPPITIEKNIKALFDIYENYFPIEFEPPKNISIKITQSDLSLALNKAMFSNYVTLEKVFEFIYSICISVDINNHIESLKSICYIFNLVNNQEDKEHINIELDYTNMFYNNSITVENLNRIWKKSMDFVVSEIFNNLDDSIFFQAINTLTILLIYNKNFLNNDTNSININHCHIETVESLFSKCIDFLYSKEPKKNSYDGRDIILLILQYTFINKNNELYENLNEEREYKIIDTFLNASSLFLNMKGDLHVLKNTCSIITFLFTKNRLLFLKSDAVIKDKLKSMLINLFKTLSEYINNTNVFNINSELDDVDSYDYINILDVIVSFSINFKLFNKEEIIAINNKIIKIFNSIDFNNNIEILKKLSEIRKKLISEYDYINDTEKILKDIESLLINTDKKQSNYDLDINLLDKMILIIKEYNSIDKKNNIYTVNNFNKLNNNIAFLKNILNTIFLYISYFNGNSKDIINEFVLLINKFKELIILCIKFYSNSYNNCCNSKSKNCCSNNIADNNNCCSTYSLNRNNCCSSVEIINNNNNCLEINNDNNKNDIELIRNISCQTFIIFINNTIVFLNNNNKDTICPEVYYLVKDVTKNIFKTFDINLIFQTDDFISNYLDNVLIIDNIYKENDILSKLQMRFEYVYLIIKNIDSLEFNEKNKSFLDKISKYIIDYCIENVFNNKFINNKCLINIIRLYSLLEFLINFNFNKLVNKNLNKVKDLCGFLEGNNFYHNKKIIVQKTKFDCNSSNTLKALNIYYNLCSICYIINYLFIKYNCKLSNDLKIPISELVQFLNILSELCKNIDKLSNFEKNTFIELFEKLPLFEFKQTFIIIKQDNSFKYKEDYMAICLTLENVLKSIDSNENSTNNSIYNIVLAFQMLLFKNYSLEMLKDNISTVIYTVMICIKKQVNIKECLVFFRNILLISETNLSDSLLKNNSIDIIIINLVSYALNHANISLNNENINLSVDSLIVVNILVEKYNSNINKETIESINMNLKKLLNNNKRKIRAIVGLILTKTML